MSDEHKVGNDVFVSYSRQNSDFVKQLVERLEQSQRDVWVDWQDIPKGSHWWREILTGIEGSDTFVFVVSPDALSSPVCAMELAHARENNKRIIPVVHVDANVDDALGKLAAQRLSKDDLERLGIRDLMTLARDNWSVVSQHNWLFFREEDNFNTVFQELIQTLETDLEHVKHHTRILVRAREWLENDQDTSYLLDGQEITIAEIWLANSSDKDPSPTSLHIDYITSSRNHAIQRQRRVLTAATIAVLVSVVGLIASIFFGVDANQQRRVAENNLITATIAQGEALNNLAIADTRGTEVARQSTQVALRAEEAKVARDEAIAEASIARSRELALRSRFMLDEDRFDLALLLAIQSWSEAETTDSIGSLYNAIRESGYRNRFLHGHTDVINTATYSADGQSILAADRDGQLILWDQNGGVLWTLTTEGYVIVDVAYDPQGSLFATGNFDGRTSQISVYDSNTKRIMETVIAHNGKIHDLSFHPNRNQLISVGQDGVARLWNSNTLDLLIESEAFPESLLTLDYSPDGSKIIVAGESGLIHLLDSQTLKKIGTSINAHSDWIFDLKFHPDGNHFASASADSSIRIWDVNSRTQISTSFTHENEWVRSVHFISDQPELLISVGEITIRQWDIDTGESEILDLSSHVITTVTKHPDSSKFTVAYEDATFVTWDLDKEVGFSTALTILESKVIANVITQSRQVLALGNQQLMVTDGISSTIIPFEDSGQITSIDYASNSGIIAIADNNGDISLLTSNGTPLAHHPMNHDGTIRSIKFSPNEQLLLSGGDDALVRIWDLANNGEIIQQFGVLPAEVTTLAFKPEGNQIAVGFRNGDILTLDIGTTEIIWHKLSQHSDMVTRVRYSPDGTQLLSGSRDGIVQLYDTRSGIALGKLIGHTDWVLDASFSPDGLWIATASADRTLRLWLAQNLQSTGSNLWTSDDWIVGTGFSNEGDLIAITGDGKIARWNMRVNDWIEIACSISNRHFSEEERIQHVSSSISDNSLCTPNV